MDISRREILYGAAATVVGALNLPHCRATAAGRFINPLKIPKLIEGVAGPNGKLFELDIMAGTSMFLPELSTPTLGISGAYLGPTVRCNVGDRVTLRVKNNMTEPTTLHWHGLHLPARQDGGPHQVVQP